MKLFHTIVDNLIDDNKKNYENRDIRDQRKWRIGTRRSH